MIQLKTKHKGNQLTIRHKLNQKEQVAYLEQSLIEQGEIPDLIPVTVQNRLTGIQMQFVLENCIPLPEYLGAGIGLEQFCRCMLEIIHVIQDCESHGISISNLEVRPEYIYYDISKKKINMLYWPIHSIKEYPNIRAMFVALTESFVCSPQEQETFFQLTYLLGKREKLDLLEWEKQIALYTGIQRTKQRQCWLYHINRQYRMELKKYPFSVGRQPGACDYAVRDALVSRCHFSLLVKEGQIGIRDNGSANGTMVDGQLLTSGQECILQNKSLIVVGRQRFQFFTE